VPCDFSSAGSASRCHNRKLDSSGSADGASSRQSVALTLFGNICFWFARMIYFLFTRCARFKLRSCSCRSCRRQIYETTKHAWEVLFLVFSCDGSFFYCSHLFNLSKKWRFPVCGAININVVRRGLSSCNFMDTGGFRNVINSQHQSGWPRFSVVLDSILRWNKSRCPSFLILHWSRFTNPVWLFAVTESSQV